MSFGNKKITVLFSILIFLCLFIVLYSGYARLSELEKENYELKKQIEELKNGAENLISEIRTLYEQEKYDDVLKKAEILHEKHNGTLEDSEAQNLVAEINTKREKEKEKEEQAKSRQEILRSVIRVSNIYTTNPNSVGGVDLYIDWVNMSEKTIKYIVFEVVPYNSVDDVVSCDIRRTSRFRGQSTGPIEPGYGERPGYRWENAWYNNTIAYPRLNKIEIEYMDGTTYDILENEIQYILY